MQVGEYGLREAVRCKHHSLKFVTFHDIFQRQKNVSASPLHCDKAQLSTYPNSVSNPQLHTPVGTFRTVLHYVDSAKRYVGCATLCGHVYVMRTVPLYVCG